MLTSHLDGVYLGQDASQNAPQAVAQAPSTPSTDVMAIPAPVPQIFGLSAYQWALLVGLAFGTFCILQQLNSSRRVS